MHLHWKHRELVKIIVRGKSFAQVKHIAISLEAESEGVLISLDKTTKGYAIIFYRGKNYRRPQIMKPRNLLTRRQALARSIELQRREVTSMHCELCSSIFPLCVSCIYLLSTGWVEFSGVKASYLKSAKQDLEIEYATCRAFGSLAPFFLEQLRFLGSEFSYILLFNSLVIIPFVCLPS